MPPRIQESQNVQAAISVSEMARRLTLSRARFYELIGEGVFPHPCYCIHSRRALYPCELVQQCIQIRESNMGANGRYVLFYRSRMASSTTDPAPSTPRRRALPNLNHRRDNSLTPIREGLASLGMAAVSDDQIRSALATAYPSSTNGIDPGAVLASVFRLLRSPQGARPQSSS